MADFAPTHPGEILLTEFLEPMGISQYRVAKAIDVPPRRINEIVHGKRGISADTALRLSRALPCVTGLGETTAVADHRYRARQDHHFRDYDDRIRSGVR